MCCGMVREGRVLWDGEGRESVVGYEGRECVMGW